MAKRESTPSPRKRGRPPAESSLDRKIMIRADDALADALAEYAAKVGVGSATAGRMILIEKLRAAGHLK